MRDEIRQRNRLKDAAVAVDVICVPIALGANIEGVERGARTLDQALRKHLDRRGFTDILDRLQPARFIDVMDLERARAIDQTVDRALHADPIAAACARVTSAVTESLDSGNFPLVLGGDHSLSIGSLAGASHMGRLGVIWIDAHGDINTPETTPSEHIHGMPLAIALGYGPSALVALGNRFDLALDDLVYIGVRDLDPGERELLRQSPAAVFTMESVDILGIDGVVQEAIRRLLDRGVEAVHVSFDLDALDPDIFPATGTRVPGGLTYREARRLLTMLRASDLPLVSVDVVELNPELDSDNSSTQIAAGLTSALLGATLA